MKIDKQIISILVKVLKLKKKHKLSNKSKIGDVKGWDSLTHFIFLMEVEKFYKIKFKTEIFNKIKSLSDVKKYLNL
tara:strand:- start:2819 stop:3046 length:228 start_codon:yes stop_codon:yes gene_type:complete